MITPENDVPVDAYQDQDSRLPSQCELYFHEKSQVYYLVISGQIMTIDKRDFETLFDEKGKFRGTRPLPDVWT